MCSSVLQVRYHMWKWSTGCGACFLMISARCVGILASPLSHSPLHHKQLFQHLHTSFMVSALLCYQDNHIGLRGKLHAYEALLYSILCWCKSPTASLLNLNVHTVYPCAATGSFLQLCGSLQTLHLPQSLRPPLSPCSTWALDPWRSLCLTPTGKKYLKCWNQVCKYNHAPALISLVI